MSLRVTLTALMGILSVLVVIAAVSFAVLTHYLSRTAQGLTREVESVRVALEFQVDLLSHSQAKDPVNRGRLEAQLGQKFSEARGYAQDPRDRELLNQAQELTEEYLRASERLKEAAPGTAAVPEAELADAVSALERFVDKSVEDARAAEAGAERWDRRGDLLGLTAAALLVVGTTLTLLWVRRVAIHDVLTISEAMRRYGGGELSSRAPETGPTELRSIARRFNEMATALARQREEQLDFLAGVVHDLRNPLGALKLATDVLSPNRPLPQEETTRHALAVVRRQIDRLNRMLGDLMDAFRLETGHVELRLEVRDLRQLARETLELFQVSGQAHRLELSLPEEPVLASCDPLRIEQVLNNLVSNAIKYSPQGGEVRITVERRGDEALIAVSDQGMGISAEDLQRIFEPFRRTSASRETIPGVGLGLFVAKRIVEAHQGRIEVDSQVGVGSTFRVLLRAEGAPASG